MKLKKRSVLCFSLLALLPIATSCSSGVKIPSDWDALVTFEQTGQTAYNKFKDTKRSGKVSFYESYLPSSLNSIVTMQSEDSRYITNLIDGLVDVDRAGNIIPGLATKYEWNADFTELKLTIRDGVKWVKNKGEGKEVYKNPKTGEEAVVSAQDWVDAAKFNLDAANGSDSSYLLTMFIQGAEEFNTYTTFKSYQALGYGIITQEKIDANAADAESKDEKVKKAYETCSANVGGLGSPTGTCGKYIDPAQINDALIAAVLGVDVSELPSIANFSRVGVTASEDKKTLTYKLVQSAPYFLSALTYTPYFPVYAPFVEAIGGVEQYGTSKDTILVNGAYVMPSYKMGTAKSIDFIRNANYWDVKNVHNYHVQVLHFPTNATDNTTRKAYEAGTIDSFTVSSRDTEGWEKYVLGKDKKGTLEKPASKDAIVVEGLGDGSTFAFMLNMNRDASKAGQANTLMSSEKEFDKYDAAGNNLEVLNTNKALANSPALRKLILKSIDIESYSNSMGKNDYDRVKYLVNTWVPKNFITYEGYTEADNAEGIMGRDFVDFTKKAFVDKFYEGNYSDENFEKAEAALGVSHVSSGEHGLGLETTRPDATKWEFKLTENGQKELDALKKAAQDEINAYNAKNAGDPIKTPVMVEFSGLAYNEDQNEDDGYWINNTNYRVYGCWIDDGKYDSNFSRPKDVKTCSQSEINSGIFRLIKNSAKNIPDNRTYQVLAAYNNMSLVISAWGPDFSDPLTFANTLVTNGDLAANVGTDVGDGNAHSTAIAAQWATYDQLVKTANADMNTKTRLEKFAQAEIELLYNLNIVRPLYMAGLGKAVTVTKRIPFRTAKATYGVSNFKYKYMETIDRPINQTEYADLRAERDVRNSTDGKF